MNATVEMPGAGAKKSKVWVWVVGVLIVGLVVFLALGRSITNDYEAAVTRQIGAPAGSVAFVDVKRYKNGVVCGTANPPGAPLKAFIVGVQGDVFLEDSTPTGAQVFKATAEKLCRE